MFMRRLWFPVVIAAAITILANALTQAQRQTVGVADPEDSIVEPYTFEAIDGTRVPAERGRFFVPENRSDPDSRNIKLEFVRFPSTNPNPGSPIVYLAGGPGSSGIDAAKGRRFPLFMALRAVSDVIAFDQRGTGASNDVSRCDTGRAYPLDQPLTRAAVVDFMVAQTTECSLFWKGSGIDLGGYNTWESAADLDELRQTLGADKITLWGISYGTHLGLATLKRYPERIDAAVLASIEGLDETVKLPARTDAYFARVQVAINSKAEAAKRFPDVGALIRRVLARLEANPPSVTVTARDGSTARLTFGKFDIQLLTAFSIADPTNLANLLGSFEAMDGGDFSQTGQFLYDLLRADFGRYSNGMSSAMDRASGISERRLAVVSEQASTSLLGDALNFPMPLLAGTYPEVPDLGYAFRSPFSSDVPTLFLSGTLDGRTYPESAMETVKGFHNAIHIMVENSGHNLFMVDPEVTERILSFLRGEDVRRDPITIGLPSLVPGD